MPRRPDPTGLIPRRTTALGALVASIAILASAVAVPAVAAAEDVPSIRILSPVGGGAYAVGYALQVAWSADDPGTGEFGMWVQDIRGTRFAEKVIAAWSGSRIRADLITLNVPDADHYRVGMGWRPTAGSGTWLGVTLSGMFQVGTPPPPPAPAITVLQPTGTATYGKHSTLPVTWTVTGASNGEFGVWVEGANGAKYVETTVPVTTEPRYSILVALTMPAASDYRAVVAWRSTIGKGDWVTSAQSPGSFSVMGDDPGGSPRVVVTAPMGTAMYRVGARLTVRWTTAWRISAGEFGVWVTRGKASPYLLTIVAPDDTASYSTTLRLTVPSAYGYRAVVGWRPTIGHGEWLSSDESPGTFNVNGSFDEHTRITAFSFQDLTPAVVGVIDEGHHQVVLQVPAHTSVTGRVATFTTTGTSVTVGGRAQVSGVTSNDFTSPVTYTVHSAYGTAQDWTVVVRPEGPVVGQAYGGGIVAYILEPGDPGYVAGETHGIIAATEDQVDNVPWAEPGFQTRPTGATGTALGTGAANTNAIVAQNPKGSAYAAAVARAYRGGGFSDWYLPSRDELHKLCLNQALIGGFVRATGGDRGEYWSSSESGRKYAWYEAITNRLEGVRLKASDDEGGQGHVRAVRRF